MEKNNLYIYLARLDKKGVEIFASFRYGEKVFPTRVRDISSLGLDRGLSARLSSEHSSKKMTHEVYAESASSLDELRKSLAKRGYANLPSHQFGGSPASSRVNRDALLTEESTMIRRSSTTR